MPGRVSRGALGGQVQQGRPAPSMGGTAGSKAGERSGMGIDAEW